MASAIVLAVSASSSSTARVQTARPTSRLMLAGRPGAKTTWAIIGSGMNDDMP
jgi:hypothetical protein